MISKLRVEPGTSPQLARRDPAGRLDIPGKEAGKALLQPLVEELGLLQNRLAAEAARSVLLVLQGLDASGKDGTIRNVLTGINPQGCRVVAFKEPTSTDLAHDYLWRVHAACPARGEIAIFNRSHYEDVVAVRAHRLQPAKVWRRRPRHICAFERLLSDEGTTIVKVFLHVSQDEQRRRLQERLDDPEKGWKLRQSDLDDHARYDELMTIYEDVIRTTSTGWAPWHIVPADHNWVRNVAVARLLVDALHRLDPTLPPRPPGITDATLE